VTTPPSDPFGSSSGQPTGYGYGAGPGPSQPQGVRTEPKAIIAMVLAVAAWTPTVPFVGAIAALVLARMARRDIEASGGRLTGLSLCTWSVVISWVHLVAVALLAVVVLLFFALPFALSL
jgi:hypothetical protein